MNVNVPENKTCPDETEAQHTNELSQLLKAANEFKPRKFKADDGDTENALHVPYSGLGNPDYIRFHEFILSDAYDLINEVIDNSDEPITTLSELREAFESYDDDGAFHQFVDSTLTWHLDMREAVKILENIENPDDDPGLWEGLTDPGEIIAAMAFWGYKSDLYHIVMGLIDDFENGEIE